MADHNPYAPPGDPAADRLLAADLVDGRAVATWVGVFALNLILPVAAGWRTFDPAARVGLGVMALAYGLAWLGLCAWWPRRSRLFVGGLTALGALQAVPIVHGIVAAVVLDVVAGMGLSVRTFGEGEVAVRGAAAGLVVAGLAGLVLFNLGVGLGFYLGLMFPDLRHPRARPGEIRFLDANKPVQDG